MNANTPSSSMPESSRSPHSGEPASQSESRADYQRLLAEAGSLRGVSLWQDARRRLKRNRAAIVSFYFLITIAIAAFLTPALPLQSPIKQDLKNRKFQPPGLQSISLGIVAHRQELKKLAEKVAAATGDEKESLANELKDRTKQDPITTLWYKPNWLTVAMVNLRVQLFGDYCVPSICGTDSLGRDVLARIFWGARVSLLVGVIATLVSLMIGVTYGATAGYLGGWVDNVMMRFVDILYSIPFIFIVIYLITILSEPKIKATLEKFYISQLVIFYFAIGAIYWLTMSRVVRGQVISLKNEQFIEAARSMGASRSRIIFRHLIPNVMGVVIVYLTLTIPAVMLFEAFLSFLGLGVTPPDVSWGLLVNEGLQVITPVKIYWWLVLFPGLALTLTLFALNFLGDGLRDALDPRMKNR